MVAWYSRGQRRAARWEWREPNWRVSRTAAMEDRYLNRSSGTGARIIGPVGIDTGVDYHTFR